MSLKPNKTIEQIMKGNPKENKLPCSKPFCPFIPYEVDCKRCYLAIPVERRQTNE